MNTLVTKKVFDRQGNAFSLEFINEQQRLVILDPVKYKLINGCAGSRKTDTLIKCALNELESNIVFLTLVSSVTYEITTRLNEIGLNIERERNNNRYKSINSSSKIEVVNFDAFVNQKLNYVLKRIKQTLDDYDITGSCFESKRELFLTFLQNKLFKPTGISLIIVDEAQDLDIVQMKIIYELAIANPKIKVFIAGDIFQTIYNNISSFSVFRKLNPKSFDLNYCWRCPKAHISFNNFLLRQHRDNWVIPEMQSSNENTLDKPFIFPHYGISDNTYASKNAKIIKTIIRNLMSFDEEIQNEDIVVIMPTSKANKLYHQLECFLDNAYHINTEGDGYHQTIDWTVVGNRTALLSIHGDKGKGHKVVFFLGLSQNSLPNFYHNETDLIPISLLNIALTRSTKYLFVGFNTIQPSIYIQKYLDYTQITKTLNIEPLAYHSWDERKLVEPYESIKEIVKKNISYKYKSFQVKEPLCRVDGIKDISKSFEHSKAFLNQIIEPLELTFGEYQDLNIEKDRKEIYYCLLGQMSEILIQRIIQPESLFQRLEQNLYYTNDDSLIVYNLDYRTIFGYDLVKYLSIHPESSFKKEIFNKFMKSVSKKRVLINHAFREVDIKPFLDIRINNEDFSSSYLWNITLLLNQIESFNYKPFINTLLNAFDDDLSILHGNIRLYANKLVDPTFEVDVDIESDYTREEISDIFAQKYYENPENKPAYFKRMIKGRLDCIHNVIYKDKLTQEYKETLEILEFKCSGFEGCSQEWIIQTYLYALLYYYNKEIDVKRITIVNFRKGKSFTFNISVTKDDLINAIEVLGPNFNWHQVELEHFKRLIYSA